MDYTKKNGVLVPKQRLFAPMLSTFGGGSARGFNPGGGGGGGDVNYSAVSTISGMLGPTSTSSGITISDTGADSLNTTMNSDRNGYFEITIPAGTYTITVDGASGWVDGGSASGNYFGKPARMSGTYTFTEETDLMYLLGQPGLKAASVQEQDAPGAGGTFLAFGHSVSSADPLLVAGGSACARNSSAYGNSTTPDASLTTTAQDANDGEEANTGGSNGGGGCVGCGYGAAGFYGNGNENRNGSQVRSSGSSCVSFSTSYSYVTSRPSTRVNSGAFRNGGQGATGYETGSTFNTITQGGFGGGAGSGNNGIGGGGGYSGGGSSYANGTNLTGGGGGSYQHSNFTNTNNSLLAVNTLRYGKLTIVTA